MDERRSTPTSGEALLPAEPGPTGARHLDAGGGAAQPYGDLSPSAAELARILAGPLPTLPAGTARQVAADLRCITSPAAEEVWGHPTWCALVVWVGRQVPAADPVPAAIDAVRRAAAASSGTPGRRPDPEALAARLRGIAERCVEVRSTALRLRMDDLVLEDPPRPPLPSSLESEAAALLRAARVDVRPPTWAVVVPALDIGVDWLATWARDTGLTGTELVASGRSADRLTSTRRLRNLFTGSAARPLVGLLLGADYWGRAARTASGQESGLVYWALRRRHETLNGLAGAVPPAAVIRSWASTLALVDAAVETGDYPVPVLVPTLAA